jgi:hypothetical protein
MRKRNKREARENIPLSFMETVKGLLSSKPPKEEIAKEKDDM